jgi:cbb3-type cytochrome oxidase subunit 1
MGLHFLKIAVVYLVIGTLLGFAMGLTQTFVLMPVHAHVLLLGWASLALAGLVYHFYPAAATTRLARFHFWLHNIGLPLFMVGLGLLLTGNESVFLLVLVSAIAVIVGLVLFAANVLLNIKSPLPAA